MPRTMKTFYCLDLDMDHPDDFAKSAKKVEARSDSDAALTMAIFEDMEDGSKARIMVADNPAVDDALVFIVTQRVDVTYKVSEGK